MRAVRFSCPALRKSKHDGVHQLYIMFLVKLTSESFEYQLSISFFFPSADVHASLSNFCFQISSSFQSHIKNESSKPDNSQTQQENMDEKAKPFR